MNAKVTNCSCATIMAPSGTYPIGPAAYIVPLCAMDPYKDFDPGSFLPEWYI